MENEFETIDYGVARVKDWNPDMRPREKAKQYGMSVLSKSELLAIILRSGRKGYPVTRMCADILAANDDSLMRLAQRQPAELLAFHGVGEAMALQIRAIIELGKRMNLESIGTKPTIRCAEDIYQFMRHTLGGLDHEEIHALFLNRRNQVMETRMITSGSATASLFDTKMILRQAIFAGAQGLIMCHNHPSGNLMPSPQDDKITRSLLKGCNAIDLRLLDHVIVTANGYYSYADSNRLHE
ncbi:MAG: DNA repair protein RadC [Muribaculaceae bacterium]|nr:DNA repair protein RadC [Muribaculaceae bacterium]